MVHEPDLCQNDLGDKQILDPAPIERNNESLEMQSIDDNNNIQDDWITSPHNPWNWSGGRKTIQMLAMSLTAFLATVSTSIGTPATAQLMAEFDISRVVAILNLTLFVLALAVGPMLGGPLSETVGRFPIYASAVPLGGLFALGASFTHNLGALFFLRFMSGFCFSPTLAVAAGSISDLYHPSQRGFPSAIFLLLCFLGPGVGPVAGSYTVARHGWRWTQRIIAIISGPAFLLTIFTKETFHPLIKSKLAGKSASGLTRVPSTAPAKDRLRTFIFVGLIRPLKMLVFEPIVTFICIYVAIEFGTLFSLFAAVPYTFGKLYNFTLEQSGLVFLTVLIGCFLGLLTIMLCDVLLYRPQIPKHAPLPVPPEHRLYGAMIASAGLPLGLFWYAWTARPDISWASPAAAIIPFAWGNLCLFVSTIQYISDTYRPDLVASAASANSLVRYGFAGVFPLFVIQMLESIGIGWGISIFGFASVVLMPFPWLLFKFGPQIRARSSYASTASPGKSPEIKA